MRVDTEYAAPEAISAVVRYKPTTRPSCQRARLRRYLTSTSDINGSGRQHS